MCLLEKLFIFNLVKSEPKKVISFKSYLDFSETHDFREMTISILHVMTSSKMLTSAESFLYTWTHIKRAKYPENLVPKALSVLELERRAKIAPPL